MAENKDIAAGKKKRARSVIERERDAARVSELYLAGLSLVAIAERLNLTNGQVRWSLEEVRRGWLESCLVDFDQRKALEIARIDNLEREYWQAWKESKEDLEYSSSEQVTNGDGSRSRASLQRRKRDGNPTFLSGVQWCIEQRLQIFGFYAPTKMSVEVMNELIDGEMKRLAASTITVTPEDASTEPIISITSSTADDTAGAD